MGTPAHLWITDNQGGQIRGDCEVYGREGSIEIFSFDHHIHIPYDNHTGSIRGTRKHAPISILKRMDESSPYFAKACCNGETLKNATLSFYKTNDSGMEEEYYRYSLEGIKVVSVSPFTNATDVGMPDLERISLAYQTINWQHLNGNIAANDNWNDR